MKSGRLLVEVDRSVSALLLMYLADGLLSRIRLLIVSHAQCVSAQWQEVSVLVLQHPYAVGARGASCSQLSVHCFINQLWQRTLCVTEL